jgi:cytidylate kinase
MNKRIVIAIDGPAGAGKSTTAKAVASELKIRYLDTGAMYRAIALFGLRSGLDARPDDLASAFSDRDLTFTGHDPQRLLLDGEDISEAIRTAEISELASMISANSRVRSELVRRQQALIAEGGVVLEGRDATTVIAPNANLKIYMTASLEERARRRSREYQTRGIEGDFASVRSEILQRDHRDITRVDSPLQVAREAIILETGGKTVQEVVAEIVKLATSLSD